MLNRVPHIYRCGDMSTTIVETPEPKPEAPAAPSDRTIDMAVEFGQLRASYDATRNELFEVKNAAISANAMLTEALGELRELRSRATSIEAKDAAVAEAVAEVQAEIAAEPESDVVEVTPPMETHVEIDQKPIGQRHWLHTLFYGGK